jgi:hypothetical protein
VRIRRWCDDFGSYLVHPLDALRPTYRTELLPTG